MKEKLMYKCDYCQKLRATVVGMERHEAQCVHNPNGHNCFNCDKAYQGDFYDDYGRITHDFPMCAYSQDGIRENWAAKCNEYNRTDSMYHHRTEKEAESALNKKG